MNNNFPKRLSSFVNPARRLLKTLRHRLGTPQVLLNFKIFFLFKINFFSIFKSL